MSPLRSRAAEIDSIHCSLGLLQAVPPKACSFSFEQLLRSDLRFFRQYPPSRQFEYQVAVRIQRVLNSKGFKRRSEIQELMHWLEDEAYALSGATGSSNRIVSRANGRRFAMARALGMLAAHPEWPNTKIAQEAGVSRTMLSEWPKYVIARAAARQAGKDHRSARAIPVSGRARKKKSR